MMLESVWPGGKARRTLVRFRFGSLLSVFRKLWRMGGHGLCVFVPHELNKRPDLPTVTLTWQACKYKVHQPRHRYILCRRLRSLLLCLCDVFRALINSLVGLSLHESSEPRSV